MMKDPDNISQYIEYYNKYDDINLICLVLDNINLNWILALSEGTIIRQIYENTKKRPNRPESR